MCGTDLDKLVRRLEKRKAKKSKEGSFKPKTRALSSPSRLEAPADAPAWAIRQMQPLTPSSEESVDTSTLVADSLPSLDLPGSSDELQSE